MYKVTGRTYDVRDKLRDCGCTWDGKVKAWMCGDAAKAKVEALIHEFVVGGRYGTKFWDIGKTMRIEEVAEV